jgi:hypothetical protein
MNTSSVFKNLPIDIKEKITEHLIDELEVRFNKNTMIHHLQLIHQQAENELEDHIIDYPDTFDNNDIIIFMKDFLYYSDTMECEYGGLTLDIDNNWIWNFGEIIKDNNNYLIKRDGNKFKKQYYKVLGK